MFDSSRFSPDPAELVPFLAHPVMANIRKLEWITPALVDVLLAAPVVPKLERVFVTDAPVRWAQYAALGMSELGTMTERGAVGLTDLPKSVTAFYARGKALAPWLTRLAKAGPQLKRFELVSPMDFVDEPVREFRFVVDRKKNTLHVIARGKNVAKALAGIKPTTFRKITVDGVLSPADKKALAKLGV